MYHCLKTNLNWRLEKEFMANSTTNFLLFTELQRKCMLYTAKGNFKIADWYACGPTAHVVVRGC
jgi:hypothetical protein